jgi:hypothetical protein
MEKGARPCGHRGAPLHRRLKGANRSPGTRSTGESRATPLLRDSGSFTHQKTPLLVSHLHRPLVPGAYGHHQCASAHFPHDENVLSTMQRVCHKMLQVEPKQLQILVGKMFKKRITANEVYFDLAMSQMLAQCYAEEVPPPRHFHPTPCKPPSTTKLTLLSRQFTQRKTGYSLDFVPISIYQVPRHCIPCRTAQLTQSGSASSRAPSLTNKQMSTILRCRNRMILKWHELKAHAQ